MHPPNLDPAALAHQLARMFAGGRERRPLIAVHGTCDDPRPLDLPGVGRFEVVRADSELDLRARMPEPSLAAPARTVFLISWTHQLPLDIAGRFSRDGQVFRVDDEVRLSRLFTAPFETIDADALTSRLAAWLLAAPPPTPLPSPGGRLTFHALWTTWLRHTWGLDLDEGGLSGLLAWAAGNAHGPRLAAALTAGAAAGVQAELESLLSRRFGEPAPSILRAWLHERGTTLLGFAILCETLAAKADDDRALHTWLALKAEPLLGARADAGPRHKLMHRLAGLVAPTLGELGRTDQRVALRAALDAADALADDHVREALIDSRRLLSSWHQRLAALGRLLAEAAARPSRDGLARAVAELRELEKHDRPHYSRDGRAAAELARAEAGVRLLAWLVDRDDASAAGLSAPARRAEGLARWYVAEGGYLDRARQAARGADGEGFGAGVAAVLAHVDAARRALDRRFAEGLVAWSADRGPELAVPLAGALERLALDYLRARPARRLLVVLLADMPWPHALDLLTSLDEDASRWAPLAWPDPDALGAHPAVLAPVPATAALCRAALLSGRAAPKGVLPPAGGEARQLAEHPGLAALQPGVTPALFVRPAHADSAGREVLAQLRDPRARLVVVILDGLPAHDGDPSRPWQARAIRPLFELLDAAQASGRAVLLASDHGRIPADRGAAPGGRAARSGARWRPWTADATVQPHETAFPAEAAWSPRDARGVVVVHDDQHRPSQPGDHGGATLAEVVTPMILLGWEGMDDEHDDPALALRAVAPPRWWHLPDQPLARPEPPRRKPARPRPEPQLPLLPLTPTPAPADPGARHPLTARLLAAPVFEARAGASSHRDKALRVVDALLRHGNAAGDEHLGALLGVPARRVGGFVALASEVLNVDGYAVLRHDPVARRSELHARLLAHCFELERP